MPAARRRQRDDADLRPDQREAGGTVVAVGTEDVEMIGKWDTDPPEGLVVDARPTRGLLQPRPFNTYVGMLPDSITLKPVARIKTSMG